VKVSDPLTLTDEEGIESNQVELITGARGRNESVEPRLVDSNDTEGMKVGQVLKHITGTLGTLGTDDHMESPGDGSESEEIEVKGSSRTCAAPLGTPDRKMSRSYSNPEPTKVLRTDELGGKSWIHGNHPHQLEQVERSGHELLHGADGESNARGDDDEGPGEHDLEQIWIRLARCGE
jgi:hypothetical protein